MGQKAPDFQAEPGPRVVTSPKSLEIQERGVSLLGALSACEEGHNKDKERRNHCRVFSYTPQSSTRARRDAASLLFFNDPYTSQVDKRHGFVFSKI